MEPYVKESTEYPGRMEFGRIEMARSPSGNVTLKEPSGPALVGTVTVPGAVVMITPLTIVIAGRPAGKRRNITPHLRHLGQADNSAPVRLKFLPSPSPSPSPSSSSAEV